MDNFVEIGGLILPSADLLITQVAQVENTLPGWWWSLSFCETSIAVSAGPGRNVPDHKHLDWAHTTEGDAGLIYITYTHSGERKVLMNDIVRITLQNMLSKLNNLGVDDRSFGLISSLIVTPDDVPFRHQRQEDLGNLKIQYQRLLDRLEAIHAA